MELTCVTQPFSESIVSHLLISKQFFDEAVSVFFRDLKLLTDLYTLSRMEQSSNHTEREIFNHLQSVALWSFGFHTPDYVRALVNLPHLREVTMELTYQILGTPDDEDAWSRPLMEAELVRCPTMKALLDLRGLRRLDISKNTRYSGPISLEEKAILQANLDQAEKLIRNQAFKPRPKGAKVKHPRGIAQALKSAKFFNPLPPRSSLALEAGQAPKPLRDNQIPSDPSAFVRLMLDRPQDLLAWTKDIKERASRKGVSSTSATSASKTAVGLPATSDMSSVKHSHSSYADHVPAASGHPTAPSSSPSFNGLMPPQRSPRQQQYHVPDIAYPPNVSRHGMGREA
jgi:hypothetical protein